MLKVNCPACGSEIDWSVMACRHCGHDLIYDATQKELSTALNLGLSLGFVAGGGLSVFYLFYIGFDAIGRFEFWPLVFILVCGGVGGYWNRRRVKGKWNGIVRYLGPRY